MIDGQKYTRKVWDKIKEHFGVTSVENDKIDCERIVEFMKADLTRVYGFEFDEKNTRIDKKGEI